MFISDAPKTLEEAKKYRYNTWAGNPNGREYSVGYCAFEVWRNPLFSQCNRKNGYGPDKLYCKQHYKMIEMCNKRT